MFFNLKWRHPETLNISLKGTEKAYHHRFIPSRCKFIVCGIYPLAKNFLIV